MIDDAEDLFAVRPKVTRRPPKALAKPECKPVPETIPLAQVERVPEVSEPVADAAAQPNPKIEPICQPSGLVASFSCVCGAQDEVREPAPETVACWSCKPARRMKRWAPGYDTPYVSARPTTAEERA